MKLLLYLNIRVRDGDCNDEINYNFKVVDDGVYEGESRIPSGKGNL